MVNLFPHPNKVLFQQPSPLKVMRKQSPDIVLSHLEKCAEVPESGSTEKNYWMRHFQSVNDLIVHNLLVLFDLQESAIELEDCRLKFGHCASVKGYPCVCAVQKLAQDQHLKQLTPLLEVNLVIVKEHFSVLIEALMCNARTALDLGVLITRMMHLTAQMTVSRHKLYLVKTMFTKDRQSS